MENNRDYEYYRLFEKAQDFMNNPDHFVHRDFIEVLKELCVFFDISKGVSEFYMSPTHERIGDGEILVDYDNGNVGEVILTKRIVSKTDAILKETLYANKGAKPLSKVDYERLDLISRCLLSFISRNRMNTLIEKLGFYDDTDYKNVRYYFRFLNRLSDENKLLGKVAICYNFKRFSIVNKEIGREKADEVMQKHTDALQDIIGDTGVVCRLGGDNFVAVFDENLTETIKDFLYGHDIVYDEENDKLVRISAYAGFYVIKKSHIDVPPSSEIMDKIHSALQVARMSKNDIIKFYDDNLRELGDYSKHVHQIFPQALKNHEFLAFYQPKVNIMTGEIIGAEALCRWKRNGEIVPPFRFIPILEQDTDICELDFYILDKVCKDINELIANNQKPVKISVNLSRKHLVDVNLHEHILEIIDKNNIPHDYIEIELTETETDVEFKDLRRIVDDLQADGISTSVDDFGIGYSSLNLIKEIPWDVLKIDRCFLPLDGENENSVTNIMYKHVVSMALDLGLQCITEGVETSRQMEILKNNKCEFAQGFLFDKPLSFDEFKSRLSDGKYEI